MSWLESFTGRSVEREPPLAFIPVDAYTPLDRLLDTPINLIGTDAGPELRSPDDRFLPCKYFDFGNLEHLDISQPDSSDMTNGCDESTLPVAALLRPDTVRQSPGVASDGEPYSCESCQSVPSTPDCRIVDEDVFDDKPKDDYEEEEEDPSTKVPAGKILLFMNLFGLTLFFDSMVS
ncbi:hypothetical protein GQR58_017326 [Nymphon striatum]|nr:hypothetical protein GQR58_017326 [Nymphon striatum]